MKTKLGSILLSVSLMFAGCTAGSPSEDDTHDDDTSLVTTAKQSAALFSETAALAIIAVDPLAAGVANENDAAAKAAAAASGYFAEGGCISAAIDPQAPSKLVLTFDDCDGPYGFADVTGKVTIEFARAGGGLSVTLASAGDLVVDDALVNVSATVTIPDLARPRAIVVKTASRLELDDDFALSLDGEFTLSWDASLCFTLAGNLTASAGTYTFSTIVDDFHRCEGECPDGSVTMTMVSTSSADTRTLQVIFDGDHTAEIIVTTPDSMHSLPVPILCS